MGLTIFCGSTARFVSDLVGNPDNRFSHDAAHIFLTKDFTLLDVVSQKRF